MRLHDPWSKQGCKWGCLGSWAGTENTGGGGHTEGPGERFESGRPVGGAAGQNRTPTAQQGDPRLHRVPECATGPGERGGGSSPPRATAGEGDFFGLGAVTCPLPSNLPLLYAQGKTYSFSLGNFAWDGFPAVAPG